MRIHALLLALPLFALLTTGCGGDGAAPTTADPQSAQQDKAQDADRPAVNQSPPGRPTPRKSSTAHTAP